MKGTGAQVKRNLPRPNEALNNLPPGQLMKDVARLVQEVIGGSRELPEVREDRGRQF